MDDERLMKVIPLGPTEPQEVSVIRGPELHGIGITGSSGIGTITVPSAQLRIWGSPSPIGSLAEFPVQQVEISELVRPIAIISFPFFIGGTAVVLDAVFLEGRQAAGWFLFCFILTILGMRDPKGRETMNTIADWMIGLR
jgi:hypothetical protein